MTKHSKFTFDLRYFIPAIFLFIIEICIAKFAHDTFIRPYLGDVLVVILIYCVVRSFLDAPVLKTAICVLLFAYVIEILQYFHIADKLGLQHSKIARVIIGTSFEWSDMFAYTIGIAIVIGLENLISYKKTIRSIK